MFSGVPVQASLAPSSSKPLPKARPEHAHAPSSGAVRRRRLSILAALLWGVSGTLAPTGAWAQPAPAAPAPAAPAAAKPKPAPAAAAGSATAATPVAAKPKPAAAAAAAPAPDKDKTPGDKPPAADKPSAAAPAARPAAAGKAARPLPGKKGKAPATPSEVEAAQARLPLPPKSPILSRAEQFQRAAPATVMLIAQHENRFNIALGVIIKPQGVVVSDSRLLSGVESGLVFAFLYDPSLAGDEDPLIFLRNHKSAALPVQVVRIDSANHLVMLQLPTPDPKKPYKALELYDVRDIVTVGLDIVALRTRGRQTLALFSGSIAAVRPDQIELEPDLTAEASGGPVLSPTGRLLGIATFADKSVSAAGVVRPVDLLHNLMHGKIGTAPQPAPAPSATEVGVESRNAVEALRISLGVALAQKLDKRPALQLQSDFIASMALHGRIPLALESGEQLNALLAGLVKDNPPKAKAASELFPLLVTDKLGKTWRRIVVKDVPKYDPLRPSGNGVAAIDDVTETMYATDTRQQLMWFDSQSKTWRNTNLSPVVHAKATAGSLYVILADGRLMSAKQDGKDAVQLYPRSLKSATLEASQGVLYLLENGSVYRYRNQAWEQKLKPIAFAMQQLVVHGEDWYGLDMTGRAFSSVAQRYIDRDGNIMRLWPIGKDLLVLTKDGQRYFYNVANDSWISWSQW